MRPAGQVGIVEGTPYASVSSVDIVVQGVGGHGSHLLGDLATANCLIEVPADVTAVTAGEMVAIRKLDEEF